VKALTYHGPGDLRPEQVADPGLLSPGDAIIRVELAAICGSDLHVWHGREVGLDPGTVMGHEFLGEIVAVGKGVTRFRRGDRAVSPFTTSCGECFYCHKGLTARCTQGQLFGWVERGEGLHGGQAELVRVPLADATLLALPAGLAPEAALLLGDVLATGYHCATLAGITAETTCAVIGCGPVGLLAVLAAAELGAERIYAIDSVPERLTRAEQFGARTRALPEEIREATEGRGVDAVLEAVGSAESMQLAFRLVRPGGTIAVVGVHHETVFPFSPAQAYDKNLTLRVGRCPARAYMETLIPLASRKQGALQSLFTHRVGLESTPEAYRMFAERRDGCIKVAVVPAL
jgi:2-desacetyl-2-hydroxyethyl bacteriochlorophyllide A dehydrogenase